MEDDVTYISRLDLAGSGGAIEGGVFQDIVILQNGDGKTDNLLEVGQRRLHVHLSASLLFPRRLLECLSASL